MAGKVVNSNFVHLSKFVASRQEIASKTATSHIRKTLCLIVKKPTAQTAHLVFADTKAIAQKTKRAVFCQRLTE